MQMKNHIKKLNQIKYILLLIVLAAVLGLIWFLNQSFVTITIAPAEAKLTVDNAPLLVSRKGVGKTNLSPGTHTIKVEAENYLTLSEEITFKRGQKISLHYSLKEKPEITTIEAGARMIASGKEADEIFYLNSAGTTLFRAKLSVSEDNKITALSTPITSARLSGINQIVWSPNKELAIFKKTDGAYLFDFKKYDFVNQTENLWSKDSGDIAWAPDGSKIAYFYAPGGEKSLMIANADNSQKTRIANLADYNIDNPFLAWSPDSQYLIIVPRNRDYGTNKIYTYDTYSGSLKELTDVGNQIQAKFSPDSSKLIYSTYSKGTGDTDPYVISLINKDSTEQKSLEIRTNTDNVVWVDNNTLLASQYSRSENSVTFYIKDLTKINEQETVQSQKTKIVNRLLLARDNTIAIYENADGVFGFKLK